MEYYQRRRRTGHECRVRSVVRTALDRGAEVYASYEGYQGLVDDGDSIRKMDWDSVGGILQLGGNFGVKPAPKPNPQAVRFNKVFLAFMSLFAVFSLPWFKQYWPVIPEKAGLISIETLVQAMEVMLDENLPVEVFHGMGFGSYILWRGYPTYRVFVDSRIELYPLRMGRISINQHGSMRLGD